MMSCARAKKIGNLAILCFLLLSFRAASHPLVCTFVDQEGDPLESVETRLVFLEAESKEEVETHYQKSNAKGRADFKNLRPGSYVVQAQLEGYMPCKVVINIQAAERLQRVLLKQKEFEDQEQKALESLNSQDFKTAIQELERLSEHYPEDASLHDNRPVPMQGFWTSIGPWLKQTEPPNWTRVLAQQKMRSSNSCCALQVKKRCKRETSRLLWSDLLL